MIDIVTYDLDRRNPHCVHFGLFCRGILASLVLLVAFLIIFTQAVTSWVFGWTRLSTGFLVELAVGPIPFGAHSLVHIDWAHGSIGLDGIVHSWTYAHPTAIVHLPNWVRAIVRNCL